VNLPRWLYLLGAVAAFGSMPTGAAAMAVPAADAPRALDSSELSNASGLPLALARTGLASGVEGLAHARQGTVTGRIVSQDAGRPLAGAQVTAVGTGLGALADGQGRYTIPGIPAGEVTIRVQILGFGVQEATVTVTSGAAVTQDFVLRREALGLDEVVVTGTAGGTQRRAIGNVVDAVDVESRMQLTAPASLQGMLAGEVSGAQIRVGGGNVGSGGNIWIRGMSSLSLNTQPIVYVDGVRVQGGQSGINTGRGDRNISRLNDFNPDDIERIEVIKGPAAATIYGTEASGGVIQIITKKGRTGEPTINLTVRQGANFLRDAESIFPVSYYLENDGSIGVMNLIRNEREAGRDLFRTGHAQSYSLSVRGGTERFRYYLSGQLEDEVGHLFGNEQNRESLRANLQANLREDLQISADMGFIRSDLAYQEDAGDNISRLIVRAIPALRDGPFRGFDTMTPEALNDIDQRERVNRSTVSVTLTHEPLSWLTQRLVVGVDASESRGSIFRPRLPDDSPRFYGASSLGRKDVSNATSYHRTFDYSATGRLNVSADWTSETSVGAQFFSREELVLDGWGIGMPSSTVSTITSAADRTSRESFVENKTFGVFLQQVVGWRGQAFVTGAVRADANSAFGEDFDAAVYPKLSATWVVSDADFWDVRWLESLRLRSAWGMSGMQPDAFAAVQTYAPAIGPNDVAALTPNTPGNPDLKPERGVELEVGFDASLLDGRLSLEMTHYRQSTKDMIIAQRLPPSMGFPATRFVNVGEVQNQGYEFSIEARPYTSRLFQKTVRLTAAHNANELIDVGGIPVSADTRGRWHHIEGFPLGVMGTKYIATAEWGPNNQLINVTCQGSAEQDFRPMPCREAPFHYIGNPQAAWTGSLTNTLGIGDHLTLNAYWTFQTDSWKYSTDAWARETTLGTSETAVLRRLGQLDPIEAASLTTTDVEHPFFERDDFIRLRELSASFSLPGEWASSLGASQASVTLTGRNLWTRTHPSFRFGDPESKSFRSQTWPGWEQARLPQGQNVTATVRFTF